MNRERLILAAVLGVALSALAIDRLMFGGEPQSAQGADDAPQSSASPFVPSTAASTASTVSSDRVATAPGSPTAERSTPDGVTPHAGDHTTAALERTIADVLTAHRASVADAVALGHIDNPFAPPPHWITTDEPVTTPDDEPLRRDAVRRFLATHQLTAVLLDDTGGAAVIDGHVRVPGDTIGAFTLFEIRPKSAILHGQGFRVEMKLARP